ncbi:transmembrane protein 229B-like isoform X2 [Rhineura floridana]|nr:transmembrane protein 229B-like isoform X2 [Rhineura floridana]XP_061453004.1 transmembrane protein 229B-like isoform X2 [Rhineura floridana]XP_061453005.1 transmembrane protein 229B-like isoform X2 [Rhineura floridana]
MGSVVEPLTPLCRAYIYAIHGYFSEIIFQAIILDEEWTFGGATSLLSLFLYGTCGFALERIYVLLRGNCCLLTRTSLYTLCIFLWQFTTGSVLRWFNACPWDFSAFHYNFMGLIALEHSLIWFVGALLLEKAIICNVLRLRLDKPWKSKECPVPRFELRDD